MQGMKRFFVALILLFVLGITLLFHNRIASYIIDNFIYRKTIVINEANQYYRDYDFNYVQQTNNFYPKNIQDIYNIFYTILNNGWTDFSFFCDDSYETCLDDIDSLTENNDALSNINNFVHVYNSFDKIYINPNNFGKIDVSVKYAYTPDLIETINDKIDEFISNNINENMSVKDKIQVFHDYVIENTQYDIDRAYLIENNLDDSNSLYSSHIAYGPLVQGFAICGGYSDAMAIFLDYLGLKNYKIATKYHVWNYVNLDDTWYHIDLTWDDPVLSNGEQIIMHNFFLITAEQLNNLNTEQHNFPTEIYSET